ncbi:acyl-CoA dehydrogenase family protein [Bermanella sp. R86510]|uniref:acyl-CoA dehydrogenase family protein n=1 Tax=unclassified Bermanella TaxID=2627862 RepID=UPI0037CBE205
MNITHEHKELFRTVKNFIENEINPNAAEWEKAGAFPAHEVFKKMGDLGLLGINKEEKYGGMGLDHSYNIYAAEALGYATCGGVPLAIGVQTDMATPAIAKFGSEELKQEFLAPAIAGDFVAAIAVSETGAGSDVAGLKTTAKKDGDDYIINGSKMWITNSTQADFFCVLANTSDDKPHKNKSLIVVPANTPGVSVGEKIDKIGMRCSDTAPVYFDDVRVPQRYRVGAEGMGFMLQMLQFQEERLWGAASGLITLEQCIEKTIEYTKERKTFGQPLIDNQAIHFRLAELQTEVECLRALTYRATELMMEKKDVTKLASMCKLKGGRLIREISDSCLQYWGGMGFTWDNPISQVYRDGRLASIGGGADEIMLGIICKYMDILPKKK